MNSEEHVCAHKKMYTLHILKILKAYGLFFNLKT